MTFSIFYEHSNPLFIKLGILKLHDLVFIMTVCQKHLIHSFSLLIKDITIIPDLLQDHHTPFPILELITENSTSDILV